MKKEDLLLSCDRTRHLVRIVRVQYGFWLFLVFLRIVPPMS